MQARHFRRDLRSRLAHPPRSASLKAYGSIIENVAEALGGVNADADLTATALRTRQRVTEPSMIVGYDEVSSEHRNRLVEIDGRRVPAHRFWTSLFAVGEDAVAVLSEVAEGPMNSRHFAAFR